jgi:hypothetical protein
MVGGMPSLPLFPLGTVLLPGARLPLQIFEPRYVAMLRDLLDRSEDERCFGVVAIRRGHEVGEDAATDLYAVGCEARIDALAATSSATGPRYPLVATGTRRFSLDGVDTLAGTPYLTAQVTWLAEPGVDDPETAGLVARVTEAHAAYRAALGAAPSAVSAPPRELPYRIVDETILELADRQRVLEAPDLPSRLRAVLAILHRESALIGAFHALPRNPDPGGAALS